MMLDLDPVYYLYTATALVHLVSYAASTHIYAHSMQQLNTVRQGVFTTYRTALDPLKYGFKAQSSTWSLKRSTN